MKRKSPLVSIGMPVYNGEKCVGQALDSLLVQDFKDFELIISDNASTDRTAEICQAYAARDKRIQYHGTEKNTGPFLNFKRVLELARGEYFMWAADDDRWEPNFISSVMPYLLQGGEMIYAMSGSDMYNHATKQRKFRSPRCLPAVNQYNDCFENCVQLIKKPISVLMYGIHRTEQLRKTKFINRKKYFDFGDLSLLIETSTMGKMHVVPKILFHVGIVEVVRPVKSFSKHKLPGFKYGYHDYYLKTCKLLVKAVTFSPMQKLYLLGLFTYHVSGLMLGHEKENMPKPLKKALELGRVFMFHIGKIFSHLFISNAREK